MLETKIPERNERGMFGDVVPGMSIYRIRSFAAVLVQLGAHDDQRQKAEAPTDVRFGASIQTITWCAIVARISRRYATPSWPPLIALA